MGGPVVRKVFEKIAERGGGQKVKLFQILLNGILGIKMPERAEIVFEILGEIQNLKQGSHGKILEGAF